MKRKLLLILIFFIYFLIIPDGIQAAFNPEKQTEQFLNAVKAKDFKTIFDMTSYYQEGISYIEANNPKMLWQKLINEYYENEKKRVFRREEGFSWQSYLESSLPDIHPATYIQTLMIFLPDNSKWKVVESKKGILQDSMRVERSVFKVYITLTYKTAEESPLIDSRLFKEAIFEVIFDAKTGLYMQSSRLGNGDVFWDKVPLKILSIRWNADGFSGLHLFIKGIGGIPPYYSTTMCGEWIVEKLKEVNIESHDDSISIHVMVSFPEESFPVLCTASITDKSGKEDIRIFTVPKMFTGLDSYCYVTSPWYEWGQGVPEHCRGPLFKLESAGMEGKKELSLAIEKWTKTEGIKEEIKVLLVKKELEKIIGMGEHAVDPLIILLKDEDDEISKNVAEALGRIGDRRAVVPLIAALNDHRPIVHLYAILALGWIRDRRAEELLKDLFEKKDEVLGSFAEPDYGRVVLAFALYQMVEVEEKEIYWEFMISALKDKERDKVVRNNAEWVLGEVGDMRALKPLKAALKDEDEDVRKKAEDAIKKISQVLQRHSSSKHLLVEKTSNFIWPVEDPVFSVNPPNDFGTKDIVKKGYYHTGIDIKSETQDESKTTVSAITEGKVVAIFKTKDTKTRCDEKTPIDNTVAADDNHGFGNTIIIEHDDNMFSLYAHLDCIELGIEIGSEISQGDKIGNLGNSAYEKRVCSNGDECNPSASKDKRITGFGKHLHLEIKKKGILTNPEGSGLHFAYTPNHPDNYGYYDPKNIIGEIVLEKAISE